MRSKTSNLIEAWLFLGEELERQDRLYRQKGWDRTELERAIRIYHEYSSVWEADEPDENR